MEFHVLGCKKLPAHPNQGHVEVPEDSLIPKIMDSHNRGAGFKEWLARVERPKIHGGQ
jgi:hypothetical protein